MLLILTDRDYEVDAAIFPDDYIKYKDAVSVRDIAEAHGHINSVDGDIRLGLTHIEKIANIASI